MKRKELDMRLAKIAQDNYAKMHTPRKSKGKKCFGNTVKAITIGLALTMFSCAVVAAGAMDFEAETGSLHANRELYPRTMVVTEIDMAVDLVALRDCTGHEWTFHGIEDWMVGDICAVILDNMETAVIDDDKIVEKRYNGTVENFSVEIYGNYIETRWANAAVSIN